MQTMTASQCDSAPRGNHEDAAYEAMLARLTARVSAITEPLFTTDAVGLWEAFLGAIPEGERQYHTCHACRRFIEGFGGLATITAAGAVPARGLSAN